MTTDTIEEIKTIDQQLAQLDKENRQFVEALGRARVVGDNYPGRSTTTILAG